MIDMLLLAGWCFEVEAGDRARAEAVTRDALEAWIGGGLGFGLDGGRRLFDPVEVFNHMKWVGLAGQDRFWAERLVTTARALVDEFAAAREPQRPLPPHRFRLSLRRSFALQAFEVGARVRLRAPLALPGAYADEIEIRPALQGAPSAEATATATTERLEVRMTAPLDRPVVIGADIWFTATDPTAATDHLSSDERELYLRKVEGPIQVTPRVEALAASLAGDLAGDSEAVAAFWDHLLDAMVCGVVRYSDVPAAALDWVLDGGWCDCHLGSALLVALCRARGTPARLVSGHFLYRLAPTHHFWAEVWIEGQGWRPFDLLTWELSEGGRDPEWRQAFAGRIDYRAVTQRLPLAFTGPMSVRLPSAWQMVQWAEGDGIVTAYCDVSDASPLYTDQIEVENLGPVARPDR